MRNLKKILCLALVLSMVLAVVSGAAYKDYADADEITKANEDYLLAAELLKDIGVVVGVEEDGKTYYKPDELLTRAELARILYVLHSGNVDGVYANGAIFEHLATTFTDVKGHWAENYIKYGQNAGYLNGKSAEIFDPDANVKAEEMATALLIVIGYKAADLAPNYPLNVVKYGYVGNDGNLFTTGLSDAYQSEDVGAHIVGLGTGLGGVYVFDTEKELFLGSEVTREEAFFMMYKAITQRDMVRKSAVANAFDEGNYYVPTGDLYVNYKFDMNFAQTEVKGVVSGTPGYNFQGGYAADGKVVIEAANGTEATYNDFGYYYTAKTANATIGYGFTFQATNWDSHIGRAVVAKNTTWTGKSLLTHYAFDFASNGTTLGLKGSDVKIDKTWEITAKEGKITIKHYDEKTGEEIKADTKTYESYYTDGFRHIYNYSNGTVLDAGALVTLLENKINSKDEVVLKVIDKKLYGVIEEQNIFGIVTADTDKDGNAKIKLLDNAEITVKYADLKKNDRVFGFYNNKTEKYELTKVEPATIVNVAVDTVDGVEKYYMESVAGTEFKLGKAFASTEYVAFNEQFKANEPAYWALYFVDGYCFDAVKTDKEQKIDLYVTAKSVVWNTVDKTLTYTFALNTKKDGKGDAYTFTKTVSSNDGTNEYFDGIAKEDTVIYTYDALTNAAISIQEFKELKVTETQQNDEPALNYVDTKVAMAADVIAKLNDVTDANIQYRVILPASGNANYNKPVVFGNSTQQTELNTAIATKTGAPYNYEIVMPEYTYVQW